MKTLITTLGIGAIATALIGGIVIAVSLLDHKVNKEKKEENSNDIIGETEMVTNQPMETEKVVYDGWKDIDEDVFNNEAVYNATYKECYCTVYSDDYMSLIIPMDKNNDEFEELYIEPWKAKEQNYIPYEYTMISGYYLNCKTGEAWSVKVVNYEFLGGYISNREEVAK